MKKVKRMAHQGQRLFTKQRNEVRGIYERI
jgi:hypothetical protein